MLPYHINKYPLFIVGILIVLQVLNVFLKMFPITPQCIFSFFFPFSFLGTKEENSTSILSRIVWPQFNFHVYKL